MPVGAWLVALVALASPAVAQDAGEWLRRMGEALPATDYQGTLLYIDGSHVETLRVFHSARDDRERLFALTGEPREVVREGGKVTCLGGGDVPLAFDGGSLVGLRPVADAAARGALPDYAIRVASRDERVAGRRAVALELRPRDGFRYGYRLWLDEATALPLRVVLRTADGEALEQLAFADIELGRAPSAEDLLPSLPGAPRSQDFAAAEEGRAGAWQVVDPPPGFTLRLHASGPNGEHMVFSDGLASVSLHIEPAGAAAPREAATRAGATHARSLRLDGHRVLAIGKVPAATVEHFARGVARKPAQDAGRGG